MPSTAAALPAHGQRASGCGRELLNPGGKAPRVLGEQLHPPGHPFLANRRRFRNGLGGRELAGKFCGEIRFRLEARGPLAIDFLDGLNDLLLHVGHRLDLFLAHRGDLGRIYIGQRPGRRGSFLLSHRISPSNPSPPQGHQKPKLRSIHGGRRALINIKKTIFSSKLTTTNAAASTLWFRVRKRPNVCNRNFAKSMSRASATFRSGGRVSSTGGAVWLTPPFTR